MLSVIIITANFIELILRHIDEINVVKGHCVRRTNFIARKPFRKANPNSAVVEVVIPSLTNVLIQF